MAVWKIKGCARCGGDLFLERDTDCYYEECLQCGYRKDLSRQRYQYKPDGTFIRIEVDQKRSEK